MLMAVGLPVKRIRRTGRQRPDTGNVHLGLGAFFRAFGCVYVADAMAASGGDWGIIGVSLPSPSREGPPNERAFSKSHLNIYAAAELRPRPVGGLRRR